jgi:hypothetical protein
MPSALQIVQRFFPSVTRVVDATAHAMIDVTKADANSRAVRDHGACAMAVACKRKLHLDGVVMSRSVAYLVKDRQAVRYRVMQHLTRELVAFDRGGTFEPGTYALRKPEAERALGARRGGVATASPKKKKKRAGLRHFTGHIRTALGGVPQ